MVTVLTRLDIRGREAIEAGPDQHDLECWVKLQTSFCSS